MESVLSLLTWLIGPSQSVSKAIGKKGQLPEISVYFSLQLRIDLVKPHLNILHCGKMHEFNNTNKIHK